MSSRGSSSAKSAARARARERRILLDAERLARDEAIDDASSEFITRSDERDKLQDKIGEVETRMGVAVRRLFALGEPQRRVSQLLDLSPERVKQLRDLPEPAAPPGPAAADVSSAVVEHARA